MLRHLLDAQYSISYDKDNRPFVIVENDILDGVPESEWVRTVKNNLREKFPDGVRVGNNEIKINNQSRQEMTFSRYMQRLLRKEPELYADKLRATANADEILKASRNWVNEALLHPRNDAMIDFARGEVQMQIGENDYTAQVIVGNRGNGNLLLYDIIDLRPTQIQEKRTGTDDITKSQRGTGNRQPIPVSGDSVAENPLPVNPSIRESGEPDTSGGIMLPTASDSDIRYSISEDFAEELEEWYYETDPRDRAISPGYFRIGTVSEPLKSIGVRDGNVYWRKSKIGTIMQDHPEIDLETAKNVPQILENPVVILKSRTQDNSITLFGDVTAANGERVMAALHLTPRAGGDMETEFTLLASAYGRSEGNVRNLLKNSEVLYLDPNKNRTNTWLMQLRVQFPSRQPAYGPIGTITYHDGEVKISGVPYDQYMQEDGEKYTPQYSISENFADEIDAWDGRSRETFQVGTVSDVLKSIGVRDGRIVWHSGKITQILRKHSTMDRNTIKQVPQILEDPIVILKSKNADSRIVMFGEIMDNAGKPVTAVLELMPTSRDGRALDLNVIASAYGKDHIKSFIGSSDLLYLDPNKKRTDTWLQSVGLQLPSDTTTYDPIGTITYHDGEVKISGVPYDQYMQEDGEKYTPQYSVDENDENERATGYDDRGERWDGTMMEIGKDQTEREAGEYLYTLYEFDEGTKIRYLAYDCKTNRLFASSPETSQVYCLTVKK